VAEQIVEVWHCLSELTVGATVWNSSLSQVVIVVQTRSDERAGSCVAYSLPLHSVSPWQVLPEEYVAATETKVFEAVPHTESRQHSRSSTVEGAVHSYSEEVSHAGVKSWHTRSLLSPGGVSSKDTPATHVVTSMHDLSEVAVGRTDSYWRG
jgi:hypothetical protein